MKRSIKHLLGRAAFASPVGHLLLANAAVIVAFHRVQDSWDPNGLTIGRDLFDRYCRFFAQHFHVVALRDLIAKLERGEDVSRHLAITFDDGYRDNVENAAPTLEHHSLPATFFVTSGWVGSDVVPWWDEMHGLRHPWMTWDQVRSLRRAGFDIGAHTRTHVDLGKTTEQDARHEILGARLELEDRLAIPVDLFAFPYGRPENCADTTRALVKASGFRCCCSCFGGVNRPGQSPYDLVRVPISPWYATPYQFGFEAALGRTG